MADGMQIVVDDSALKRAVAVLRDRATPVVAGEFKQATIESLSFGQGFVANYPPKPQDYRMTFVSDRQRRWFFAALRAGEIEVPYVRTGTLGRRWRWMVDAVRTDANQVRGLLSNVTPYAHWVQDEGFQAGVHRGRWPTLQQLERTPAKRMSTFFNRAVDRATRTLAKLVGP